MNYYHKEAKTKAHRLTGIINNIAHHSSISTLPIFGRLLCGHRACLSHTLYGCIYYNISLLPCQAGIEK